MQEFRHIWEKAVEELSHSVTETAMDLWIRPIRPVKYENDCAVLLVDSPFHRDIIMSKYRNMIRDVLTGIVGFEMDVRVITAEEDKKVHIAPIASPEITDVVPKDPSSEQTFDTFLVGDSNKHAHAACLAVARCFPAHPYNPLFIYGNTGLGKTHLLFAIKNEIEKNHPDANLLYIRSENFINEFISYLGKGNMEEFKNKYRTVDVLLVDDIQFIAGKDQIQNEFFHTFESLIQANKQIILTSDRPPRDIQLLESRLKSRFESGLITDIYMPEYELKVAFIKQKAQAYNLYIPDEVVDFIAQRIKNNIRQLEGVMKKLTAFQLISNSPPNIAIAQSAIRDITNENEPNPVIVDKVISEISREWEVPAEDIRGTKRLQNIVTARQVAMYILRDITDLSLPEIGKYFGGKDHATVFHSIKKIEDRVEAEPMLKARIEEVKRNIKNY